MAEADAGTFHRQWNAPPVGRFLWDGKPVAIETVEAVLAASTASFAERGYGLFSLRERNAGPHAEPVGFAGLRLPDGQTHPELLFALDPPFWSRGYATEASEAALSCAFGGLGLPEVTASANPDNAASHRVLLRLGFSRTGLVRTPVEDLYTYALRRGEFRAEGRAPARMETP
jgi:RimJ/RimL family protein N-acetyltransferase